MAIDVVFPPETPVLEIRIALRHLSLHHLPADTFFGSTALFDDPDAMILEHVSPYCHRPFWPLCSEMLFVDAKRYLVVTEASEESWTTALNEVMSNDVEVAGMRLRWKPSKCGGRAFATPSRTPVALAAARRRGPGRSTLMDTIAVVAVQGELGHQDLNVMLILMRHVVSSTGLSLAAAVDAERPRAGEYIHLASRDPLAPPGRMRVFLNSLEEVRRLYAALHGQSVLVNGDFVAVTVANDAVALERASGNDPRASPQGAVAPSVVRGAP